MWVRQNSEMCFIDVKGGVAIRGMQISGGQLKKEERGSLL